MNSKKILFYEEAKRLYVEEGMSIDIIVKLLNNKLSRKTLYNWKNEFKWDEQRKRFMDEQKSLSEQIRDILRDALKRAKADPTPHNIYAMLKAMSALKLLHSIPENNEETKERKISPETIKHIEELLGL